MLKKPIILSLILWFLLFLPLLLVSKTVRIGREIVKLNTGKLRAESIYSEEVRKENSLRYLLIRSTVYGGHIKDSVMATLSHRQHTTSSIFFVHNPTLDIANRSKR